jgi:hypothetical protein
MADELASRRSRRKQVVTALSRHAVEAALESVLMPEELIAEVLEHAETLERPEPAPAAV